MILPSKRLSILFKCLGFLIGALDVYLLDQGKLEGQLKYWPL